MTGDSITSINSINKPPAVSRFFHRLREGAVSRRNWRIALVILGVYNALVIINIPQIYIYNAQSPQPLKWWVPIISLIFNYNLWTIATPFVLQLGYIFPVAKHNLLRTLALHLCAAGVTGIFINIGTNFNTWLLGDAGGVETFWTNVLSFSSMGLARYLSGAFIQYSIILITQKAYIHYWEFRDREFRLQQAELKALKTQLHPHFLFNTLNAIAALVYVSPPDATKTITQLSDLLRQTLHYNKAQEVTLKEELDFLRKYLQIQQTLLQERLEIEWAIEPETLDALVPNMLLQPLVENSIRHGIAPKKDGGRIEIFSRQVSDSLLLEVKDSGLGSQSRQEKNDGGIGLKNSAARLYHLYGENQKFESGAIAGAEGWRVTMTIPFREQT